MREKGNPREGNSTRTNTQPLWPAPQRLSEYIARNSERRTPPTPSRHPIHEHIRNGTALAVSGLAALGLTYVLHHMDNDVVEYLHRGDLHTLPNGEQVYFGWTLGSGHYEGTWDAEEEKYIIYDPTDARTIRIVDPYKVGNKDGELTAAELQVALEKTVTVTIVEE